jgi:ABC-type Zn uptake system ZnuABC Zn-binding protein ZnuA/ABC-type Mn2+/Zn2+ transport system ATPase subunit
MKKVCFCLFYFYFFSNQSGFATPPKVVATINIIADMAQQVAGSQLNVISLLPAGTDPHTYEPSPGDATTISEADLILKNGLNLEGWLDKLIASAGSNARIGVVSDLVKPIVAEGYHNSFDPHAWMSIQNAILYVQAIDSIFSVAYPEHALEFHKNADAYILKLNRVEEQIVKWIESIPKEKRYLITSHDAFRYFSKSYNFEVASIMGTSTDADVSLKDINHLIQIIKNYGVPAIFVEVAINPKILQQLAKDLGVKIGGKIFTDSFGPKGSVAENYIGMMLFNVKTISNALNAVPTSNMATSWSEPLGLVLVVLVAFGLAFVWVIFNIYPKFKNEVNWTDYKLEIKNLSVMVGRKMILSNLFLELKPGKLYGILGANGSGKSTLVKTIVGLYEPLSGNILIHGKPFSQFLRQIAYLPQKEEFDMDFPATVSDVVKLGFFPGQEGMGKLSELQISQFEQVLDQLEIRQLKDRQIAQLSGGQFQRTLLARALCQKAEIFILDEPFVGVDHATEEILMKLLKDLASNGKMVLIVHHDLTKVRSYFDALVMINQRIIACGPVDEVFTEENIQATYSGKVTLLQKALQLIKPGIG